MLPLSSGRILRLNVSLPKRQAASWLSHDVMAVDPNLLAVAIGPMSWPPNVIGMSDIITRAAGIVWSIANLDRHGAWITCVVGPTTIVGPTTTTIAGFATIVGSAAIVGHAAVI